MPEQQSIDIAVAKMFDWLVDRRHCTIKWQKRADDGQKLAKEAQKESVGDEIFQKLSDEIGIKSHGVDFIVAQTLLQRMETKDGGAGWTGIGATQRVKRWSAVVAAYQKDNANWAECATTLTRLVQKELPSIERNILKSVNRQEDLLTRRDSLIKSAAACLTRFHNACSRLSIDSSIPIKAQILKEVQSLPTNILLLSEKMGLLADSRKYYLEYIQKACKLNDVEGELPLLKLIVKNPAATMFEYHQGKAPTRVIRDIDHIHMEEVNTEEVESTDDFEIEMVEEFEIEEVDGIEVVDDDDNGVVVCQTTVAKGSDALYLLEDPQVRQKLLDDIAELESFIAVRQDAGGRTEDREKMKSWMKVINDIHNELSSDKIMNMFKLSDNPNAADRIVQELEVNKVSAQKREADAKAALEERQDLKTEERRLIELKKVVIVKAEAIKEYLKKEISQKYNGRVVHITGCKL